VGGCMLKLVDENYKYLMILFLAIYLINSIYLHEVTITFTVILLVIVLELFIHRHQIKQLSYSQLAIMGVVIIAGIAGIVYLLVLLQIFIEPFSLPSAVETILLVLFLAIGLYVLWQFLKKLFKRALEH
jgi:protein-S-isoprenylcysteine O-methyltransferase Ste14